MDHDPHREEPLPSRWSALLFWGKTRVFQWQRTTRELQARPPLHAPRTELADCAVLAETRSPLWTQTTPAEFPLTAGKIHNLRIAARKLHGLEIPAGNVFSFWRQLGRPTRGNGYANGRELREGCIVPSVGGGLCHLTGLLYGAALEAGLEIVERHAHSRVIPGSLAEQNKDATVFWNYVDLRFRAPFAWRLEVQLTATDLVVRIRANHAPVPVRDTVLAPVGAPVRASATGDCLTCGMVSCFRHPSATKNHAPALGHSAFLLDGVWPEFAQWCRSHSREGDHWHTPLDGVRWKKANYQWSPPSHVRVSHATFSTLYRSFQQRKLPSQGAMRQRALLEGDAELARTYARKLDPTCRHLVIAQNLLPHLWRDGVLGGRTFDVLVTRWPMEELHHRLDRAAKAHPQSPLLGDFRADADLVRAETEAFTAAARLITPHRAIARHFGTRALLLDWDLPKVTSREVSPDQPPRLFLPCSALGRKGIFELEDALKQFDAELLVLGGATEGAANPLPAMRWRRSALTELAGASAVVLPAWIEHQPRLALRALAMGIPVIASRECGLPEHPLVYELPTLDSHALRETLEKVLIPHPSACVS